ncbi:MAG: ATP-dependent Clp protease adaptor ClpS [Bacteroidaceae bacterium]|nr:ATP-dependent Clp protease adaptor ClpS [Bacteroidaceae bacterium]
MEQNEQQSGTRTRIRHYEPEMYDVVFLNDDFTTMDFVIEVLRVVFFHTPATATTIMLTVHKKGSCVVGTYTLDTALSKQQKAIDMAREAGYPLRIKILPHKA